MNQITLFNLRNKHKTLFLQLSCDVSLLPPFHSQQIEQSSPAIPFSPVIDINSEEFQFSWLIFDPAATLTITLKDRISLQTLGAMKLSLQQIEYEQSEIDMDQAPIYNPLAIHRSQRTLTIKTYDLLHKSSTSLNTIGSLSFAVYYTEQPQNLLSSQMPPLPPVPDMTPAVASALWVRAWQIAKIFVDAVELIKFGVSWEFPPLSIAIVVGYFAGVLLFSFDYLHFYLLVGVILLLITTFVLRKKHLIAKTIQTNESALNSSYYVALLRSSQA